MIFEHLDYREFLKSTLLEKAAGREGYSLRAFSQKVGVSTSFLSEVMNAKKSLSVELAFKIAVKLDLTETETQYLCVLVQLEQEQEQDPEFREVLVKRLQKLNPKRKTHDLSADLFKSIADWHHYAILEMTYVSGLRLEPAVIAKKLGISKIEADLALERLLRLELLERDAKTGSYKKAHSYVLAESQIPNTALKQYHRQVLEKALESLKAQGPDERMSATDIIPIDTRHLAKVDRLSREFSSAVLKLSEESKVKDSVYALSVHFFNLMKK